MSSDTLHIVFSNSGARSLRGALRELGRADRIACLYDDLSYGPIDPPDPELRHRWVADQLGFTGWPETPEGNSPYVETEFGDLEWDDIPATSRAFWTKALAPKPRKILWISWRSAKDTAGYLEWIWRAGEASCEIVDLTDATTSHPHPYAPPGPRPAYSLGQLWSDDIVADELIERALPLLPAARARHRALWGRLRAENAALRVVADGQLVSAPITAFDDLLLSNARKFWRKVAMVVGMTMSNQDNSGVLAHPEMVLAGRVRALIDAGRLEFEGCDPFEMRFSEVRLTPPEQDTPGDTGPAA